MSVAKAIFWPVTNLWEIIIDEKVEYLAPYALMIFLIGPKNLWELAKAQGGQIDPKMFLIAYGAGAGITFGLNVTGL